MRLIIKMLPVGDQTKCIATNIGTWGRGARIDPGVPGEDLQPVYSVVSERLHGMKKSWNGLRRSLHESILIDELTRPRPRPAMVI